MASTFLAVGDPRDLLTCSVQHILKHNYCSELSVTCEVYLDAGSQVPYGHLHFEGFSLKFPLPRLDSAGSFGPFCDEVQDALEKASVYFTRDVLHGLLSKQGVHLVAVVGGYGHGSIQMLDFSKGLLSFVVPTPPYGGDAPASPVAYDPLRIESYELVAFSGGTIPAYILCPVGQRPSCEFVHMTFSDFPLLKILPSSQGLHVSNTAFVTYKGGSRPLNMGLGGI